MKTLRQFINYVSVLMLFSISICCLWGIPIMMLEFNLANAEVLTVLEYVPLFVEPIMFWSMLLFFAFLMIDIVLSYFDKTVANEPRLFETGENILDTPIK